MKVSAGSSIYKYILYFLLITSVALLGIFLHTKSPQPATKSPYLTGTTINLAAAESYWKLHIQKNGLQSAQAAFEAEGEMLTVPQAHVLGHAYGFALFDSIGTSGLLQCNDLFGYGCYHGIIGRGIAILGTNAITQFAAVCNTKTDFERRACFHGIGHGVMGYDGYNETGLAEALAACTPFVSTDISECTQGVFMEYNQPRLAATNTSEILNPRPLELSKKYEPCPSLPAATQKMCYYELPRWWAAAAPSNKTVNLAGTYCDQLTDASLSAMCFAGLGNLIPDLDNFDVATSKKWCIGSTQSHGHQLQCLTAAAVKFGTYGRSDFLELCSDFGLTGKDLTFCTENALALPPPIAQ